MRRLISVVAIILGWASTGWTAQPSALTTLRAIHLLSNEEAGHALPVTFEATVTYFRPYEKTMFVQDGDVAIYVQATTQAKLVPGDRIRVKGTTHESFRPYVLSNNIAFLHHGSLPEPLPASYDDLIHARRDCMLVKVRAVVRAADLALSADQTYASLQMMTPGGSVDAAIDQNDPNILNGLLDAEVEVTGAVSGRFDGKMQETGIVLHVPTPDYVRVIRRASASPWTYPLTHMDEVLAGYNVRNLSQRIRVQGVITYYQPGSALVLQNGKRSLWIMTQTRSNLQIGDVADATGFPDVHDGFLTLTHGEVLDSRMQAPVLPHLASWHELSQGRNVFDLVSIEGQVVREVREAAQDEYVLVSDGQLFTAIYRHPPPARPLPVPPMKQIAVGSKVRVSGVCILEDSNPFDAQVPFNVLMRSFADIAVVAQPPWLSVESLTRIVSILLAVMVATGAWGWTLKEKVQRQSAALASRIEAEAMLERQNALLEQRRSRILEDINGPRPLTEIIAQIAELVSLHLDGAPCWCALSDGTEPGKCPTDSRDLRIVRKDIPSHCGPALGTLFAGLDPRTRPLGRESEALALGTRLASLAIETRRLYSDLLHRSEFDLLTDIHNRFSLDQHLEALIAEAREQAGIFGLIYVDLDEFKQVNDIYGHHVGDHYLQNVSSRMKRQLRNGDLLARVGGDEFAVLVRIVGSQADVEEVALRLEHCFDDSFTVDGCVLHGSASVGLALYPEDGVTKDSLLSAADAAMYMAKHTKRALRTLRREHPRSAVIPSSN